MCAKTRWCEEETEWQRFLYLYEQLSRLHYNYGLMSVCLCVWIGREPVFCALDSFEMAEISLALRDSFTWNIIMERSTNWTTSRQTNTIYPFELNESNRNSEKKKKKRELNRFDLFPFAQTFNVWTVSYFWKSKVMYTRLLVLTLTFQCEHRFFFFFLNAMKMNELTIAAIKQNIKTSIKRRSDDLRFLHWKAKCFSLFLCNCNSNQTNYHLNNQWNVYYRFGIVTTKRIACAWIDEQK